MRLRLLLSQSALLYFYSSDLIIINQAETHQPFHAVMDREQYRAVIANAHKHGT